MKRLLVVDDEQALCEILQFNLQANGYEVETANSAEEAVGMRIDRFDLLLLDVMMDGMSGFELAKKLRAEGLSLPIIFLTAKDGEDDRVKGLEIGGDDYIAKPFAIREVLARIAAVLRRSTTQPTSLPGNSLQFEQLIIDLDSKKVTINGEDMAFTKTEFELLSLLMENRGRVFSRQELINRAWPNDVIVSDRTVDVNITRLRKKIGPYADCIATRMGFGYYFK
jgi:DNA-binding response OmpR family regulator